MNKIVFAVLLTCASARAESFRAAWTVDVYDGDQISLHERNLAIHDKCWGYSLSPTESLSECSIFVRSPAHGNNEDLARIGMRFRGRYDASDAFTFDFDLATWGMIGGGQDGPYFSTSLNLLLTESREIRFNLGYETRVPERYEPFLAVVRLTRVLPCASAAECSRRLE